MKRIKKLLLAAVIGLVLLVLLALLGVRFFLDDAIKRGVETVGPMVAQVDVKLDHVNVSLLSGSGKLQGLLIGNPQGFKSPAAIQLRSALLEIQPRSLLSDKVVIKTINIQAPEITFETDLKSVNLKKILANVEASTGGGSQPKPPAAAKETKPARKLQVDELLITGGKVHVSLTALGGRSVDVMLPEIRLTGLGQGPDGITPADLTAKVLRAVLDGSIQAGSGSVAELVKSATDLTKGFSAEAATNAQKAVENLGSGLGGLLKKKK
jgi:hypothetical protein